MRHSSIISVLILAVALSEIQSTPLESNLSENDKDALNKVGKGLQNFNDESLLEELIGKESEELSRIIRQPSGAEGSPPGGSGSSSANAFSSSSFNILTFRDVLSRMDSFGGILGELLKFVLQLLSTVVSGLLGL